METPDAGRAVGVETLQSRLDQKRKISNASKTSCFTKTAKITKNNPTVTKTIMNMSKTSSFTKTAKATNAIANVTKTITKTYR